jgi:hypothetical protein
MHTLYRDANGEMDKVDWLICFVEDRLIMWIYERLIRHLVCK